MLAVEDTESPRLFHLWSSVVALAAACGRKAWVPFGVVGKVFPNHYVLLIGPPAARKSVAMNIAYRLTKESTNVRFAPTDTGGQRQGLLRAMAREDKSEELGDALEAGLNDPFQSVESQEVLKEMQESLSKLDKADWHTLSAFWSELSGALGQANYSLMDFLVRTYDGEDYRYETKNSDMVLEDTLMNILACTTPTSMSVTLPPSAEGHGFLSRFILVHGDANYKDVVWPTLPPADIVMRLKETLSFVNTNIKGQAGITKQVQDYAAGLYNVQLEIDDPRFLHYKSRRFTHLLKLSHVIALSRQSNDLEKDDVELAHAILRVTERVMPEALGQFGLSPLSKLKQGILEFIRTSGGPVMLPAIQAAFHRDARPMDITEALQDLKSAGVLHNIQDEKSGHLLYAAKRVKKDKREEELVNLLTEG